MASPPTLLVATSGTKLAATAFNSGVESALAFLMTPPRVHAYNSTGISCASGTATLMTFNNDVYDTDTMHNTSSSTSRIVINTDGTYRFHFHTQLGVQTFTNLLLDVRMNAGGNIANGTSIRAAQNYTSGGTLRLIDFEFELSMTTGNYVEFFVTQSNAGASASTTSAVDTLATCVQAQWVGTT